VLAEIGADISGETPRPIDPELLRTVDLVVTLGREAVVEVPSGVELRNLDTDEPSERGTDGIERMRLVRDDINARVHELLTELAPTVTQRAELETVMSDGVPGGADGIRPADARSGRGCRRSPLRALDDEGDAEPVRLSRHLPTSGDRVSQRGVTISVSTKSPGGFAARCRTREH
jgi:hypothetical protein